MSKREVKVIEKEINPLVAAAENMKIRSDADMKQATELLSKLNKVNDRIEAEENKVVIPLKEALEAEKSRWRPFKIMYKGAIDLLRSELSRFQTEKVKAAKEEEAKIAERTGAGKGKFSIDTAVKKISEIEQPEKRIETIEGLVSFRTDKVLKIVDVSLVPRKYLMVDEKAVLAALIAGNDVPGAVIEEVQVPINKRRK